MAFSRARGRPRAGRHSSWSTAASMHVASRARLGFRLHVSKQGRRPGAQGLAPSVAVEARPGWRVASAACWGSGVGRLEAGSFTEMQNSEIRLWFAAGERSLGVQRGAMIGGDSMPMLGKDFAWADQDGQDGQDGQGKEYPRH